MTQAICVAATSFALSYPIGPLLAADIHVNRVFDSGAGSLRQELSGQMAGDRLAFDPILNGTTLVNGRPIVVSQSTTFLDQNTISLTDNHAFQLAAPLTVDWAGSLMLNGILSDGTSAGSLFKTGLGSLTLSGTNTYTGGTTIGGGTIFVLNSNALGTGALTVTNLVSNPILDLANGVKLANDVLLQSNLILNTGTGTTTELGGTISDSGGTFGINKTGTGTLILSGENSFTGGVYVTNDSTIRVLNSSGLGTGTVTVAGALTLDIASGLNVANHFSLGNTFVANVNSGTSTLSGLIDEIALGSGSLMKTGAGTLILGGTTAYTGGTTVSQGILQSDSISLTGNVHNNGTVIFNQTVDGTYAGNIDGTGNLIKTGIGTLIFAGSHSYLGPTTLNTGELQVQGTMTSDIIVSSTDAALTGTGTTGGVTNNGFVQPGNAGIGILHVNGDFTQQSGGTTEIKFVNSGNTPGTNNDNINVTGQAKLDGMLKVFAVGGGTFTAGTQYTILNATGGVTGKYFEASSNLSMFGVDVTYGPNDVTFQLHQTTSLHAAATTSNQASIGTALDNLALSSSGGLFAMINTLGIQPVAQQQQSMNQLSGSVYGDTQTIGLQVGDQLQQRITSRLVNNGQFLAGQSNEDSDLRGQSPMIGSTKGWVQGYGMSGSLRGDGNAAGVNYNQGGALYGMDWGNDDSGLIGVMGGNSYVGFREGFGGSGQSTSYQVGVYALRHNELAYLLGSTNYGYDTFGVNRGVTVGGFNQSLHGNYNGHQLGANVETGLKLAAGGLHLQPLVGLQYLYLAQQGFNETGGPAALNVAANQANSLRTNIGGRIAIDQITTSSGAVWTPYVQARLISELLNNDRIINASFNGAPAGGTFTSSGSHPGSNYGLVGTGMQLRLNYNWSLYGNVDLVFGGRIQTQTGSGGIVYSW